MWHKTGIAMAGLFGAAAVMIGAFHAHGLRHVFEQRLSGAELERSLALCQTAYQYQLVHAAALLGAACLAQGDSGRAIRVALAAIILGVTLFSGSLYALAFLQVGWFAHIAPFGGSALIVGWLALAYAGITMRGTTSQVH